MEMILFVGLQASGKSSFFYEKFYRTHIRINLDMLRTRNREKILIEACFQAKQPFVVDNTNPTVELRNNYIQSARKHGFPVIGYYFQSKIDDCLARNALRQSQEQVPEVGILATYKKMEIPSVEEGFDQLNYIKLQTTGKFLVEEWSP